MKLTINRDLQGRISGVRRSGADAHQGPKPRDEDVELSQAQIDRMLQIEYLGLRLRVEGLTWKEIAGELKFDVELIRWRVLNGIRHALDPTLRRNSTPPLIVRRSAGR